MRVVFKAAPHGGVQARPAQVGRNRAAANADGLCVAPVHLFDRAFKRVHDGRVLPCRRRFNRLYFLARNFHMEFLFNARDSFLHFLAHRFERITRQNAAVHVKNILAGNRIYVLNIRVFFCGLKRRVRRRKKLVNLAKMPFHAVERNCQIARGKKRVVALMRHRAVRLRAVRGKFEPENIFFGNLYAFT